MLEVDPRCLAGTMEGELDAGAIPGVVRVVEIDPFTPPSIETDWTPASEIARTSCIAAAEFRFTPRSLGAKRAERALPGEDWSIGICDVDLLFDFTFFRSSFRRRGGLSVVGGA